MVAAVVVVGDHRGIAVDAQGRETRGGLGGGREEVRDRAFTYRQVAGPEDMHCARQMADPVFGVGVLLLIPIAAVGDQDGGIVEVRG